MKRDFLVIKYSGRNSFEKFFSDQMEKEGIDVLDEDIMYPNPSDSRLLKIRKIFDLWKYKKIINEYTNIIIFADGRLPVILTYYLKNRNSRLIIWRWNSIGKVDKAFDKLKKYGEIWTFDEKDAELNSWKLNTQFYFKNKSLESNLVTLKKAYFVGDNKGREKILEKLYDILTRENVTCDFWVSNKKGNSSAIKNIEDFISYEDIIHEVNRHSILVDLVKNGQTGMTIRTMESLFYGKKLLTNNKALKEADFYDSNNIFIINEENIDNIKDFLTRDYKIINSSIIDKYTFKCWLHRFKE